MRKITRDSVNAFTAGQPFGRQNMAVMVEANPEIGGNDVSLLLHGNLIASRNTNQSFINITTAGWDTVTTRNRLNALVHTLTGGFVGKHRGQLYVMPSHDANCIDWDGEKFTISINLREGEARA